METSSYINIDLPAPLAATLHKVRLALAEEEAAAPVSDNQRLHDEVSPAMMIAQGIDLEEHQ